MTSNVQPSAVVAAEVVAIVNALHVRDQLSR